MISGIEFSLSQIGLTEAEISVYLHLIQSGPKSGYQIAKDTKRTKSTVYFLLENLREKGLVLKSPGTRKQTFTAKDPQEFLQEKRNELERFERELPKLRALEQREQKPTILYFDGYEGYAQALEYLTERIVDNTIHALFTYTPDKILTDARLKVVTHYFSVWGEDDVVVRGISPYDEQAVPWLRSLIQKNLYPWKVRSLPMDVYAPLVVKFVTGYITLIHARNKGQTIIIENEDLAQAELQNFEILWETAGEESDLLQG